MSLTIENGGTRPEAFPKEISVPLRLIILRSSSKLGEGNMNTSSLQFPLINYLRVLAYTVIDDMRPLAVGELRDTFDRIFILVQDDMVSTVSLR